MVEGKWHPVVDTCARKPNDPVGTSHVSLFGKSLTLRSCSSPLKRDGNLLPFRLARVTSRLRKNLWGAVCVGCPHLPSAGPDGRMVSRRNRYRQLPALRLI